MQQMQQNEKRQESQPYALLSADGTTLTFKYDKLFNLDYSDGRQIFLLPWKETPSWTNEENGNPSITTVVFHPSFDAYHGLTSTERMFYGLSSLNTITDPQYLHTENVTSMHGMFSGCSSFYYLPMLSQLNTSKVTDMSSMFYGCTNMVRLDLSSLDLHKVDAVSQMFENCRSLQSIICDRAWRGSGYSTNGMFQGCVNLRSVWMTYDPEKTDGTYAAPLYGYFTPSDPIPYARISENTGEKHLIFHYDTSSANWNSQPVFPITEHGDPGWLSLAESITRVEFLDNFANYRPMNTSEWFCGMKALTQILGISNLNTEHVISMYYMFSGCESLTSLDLSGFNTELVGSFSSMFSDCKNLTSLDLSSFRTPSATMFSDMFKGCSKLATVNLSGFNTEKAYSFDGMFSGCKSLTSLDLSHFYTPKIYDITHMFEDCSLLETVDVSGFDVSNVYDMKYMFYNCKKLHTIYCNDDWQHDGLTSNSMFEGCNSLKAAGLGYYNDHVFDATLANPTTGYFIAKPAEAYALVSDDGSALTFYYDGKRNDREGITYDIGNYGRHIASTVSVDFDPSFMRYRPTTTASMFSGLYNLGTINHLSRLNTQNVTTMQGMFKRCAKLTSLDLSSFNTGKVTSMTSMFEGCLQLTSLDLSSFNTAEVTNMSSMFEGCSGLLTVDLSSFNTQKATNMSCMFKDTGLTTLDLTAFDTHQVTDMGYMFNNSSALETIYCNSDWNRSDGALASRNMFFGCQNLVGAIAYDKDKHDASYANPTTGYFTSLIGPEAYAVVDGGTLTFYYDDQKEERQGFGINERVEVGGVSYPKWIHDKGNLNGQFTNAPITMAVFDESFADYQRLTDASYMFYGLTYLDSIEGLDRLYTGNITDMSHMFANCDSLKSIDLSSFSTSQVTDMSYMFNGVSVVTLDLTAFSASSLQHADGMFQNCKQLTTIKANADWTGSFSSSDMFAGCAKLEGGRGTLFDAGHTDGTYARFDLGSTRPGYFTNVNAKIKRGDIDGNGQVTIADVTTLVSIVSGSATASNYVKQAANMDGNPELTIDDVLLIVHNILSGFSPDDDEQLQQMKDQVAELLKKVIDAMRKVENIDKWNPRNLLYLLSYLSEDRDVLRALEARVNAIVTKEDRDNSMEEIYETINLIDKDIDQIVNQAEDEF